jgi:mRNA interferase RelE/StbE
LSKYQVVVPAKIGRKLTEIPEPELLRIVGAIEILSENPYPPNAAKLSGVDAYRIRIGGYRIIYEIRQTELIILLVDLGDGKEVY